MLSTNNQMNLICEPELYSPSVNADGNFIDVVPPVPSVGIRCPCACRKDKVYESHTLFASHIKTKAHQTWLHNLNLNKGNLYVQCEKYRETVAQQQSIIAEQSNKIAQLELDLRATTQCLAIQLKSAPVQVTNLLD